MPDESTPMPATLLDRTRPAGRRLIAVPGSRNGTRAVERAAQPVHLRGLNAWYGDAHVVKDLTLSFGANEATALIGPSGSGKSTVVRCINRLHEEVRGARVAGAVALGDVDVYDRRVDPVAVRRAIGMVFQRPNPFPTMSIFDNVAAGVRLVSRRVDPDLVESALRRANLWDEVKDRLHRPGVSLSGGQQQRLCIARALAVDPEVLLMDEPASALDPISTLRIEELVEELKARVTIVIVTHNLQQAARVADRTAFLLDGRLVEAGPTERIFGAPADERTEAYVSGRFG
jgi:phosphate transport system ATP-binding protein